MSASKINKSINSAVRNTNALIILDRDGVINVDSDRYIKSPEEWIPIESSLRAIGKLNRAGYKVSVATNQSGIARGMFDAVALATIHKKMEVELAKVGAHIDALEYCSDHSDSPGPDRKPNTGMIDKLLTLFKAEPSETWLVGDSISDITCAYQASCKPALVLTGKGKATKIDKDFPKNTLVFKNLDAFVKHLVD